MSKINIKVKLTGPDENLDKTFIGLRNKNKIIYNENNISVTLILNDYEIIMKRVCAEYEINLKFQDKKTTISNYKLFGVNKLFDLKTYTNELLITDNKIIINYNLEGNEFSFILEVTNEYNIEK